MILNSHKKEWKIMYELSAFDNPEKIREKTYLNNKNDQN